MKLIEICVNCPTRDVALALSADLIERRLVACSNTPVELESRYRWKGKIEAESEVPMLVKTREELFESVANRVEELHPYETPSIIGILVDRVNQDYLEWIYAETVAESNE